MEPFILDDNSKLYIFEQGDTAMFVVVHADGTSEMVVERGN